jgi:hypothetical protein
MASYEQLNFKTARQIMEFYTARLVGVYRLRPSNNAASQAKALNRAAPVALRVSG